MPRHRPVLLVGILLVLAAVAPWAGTADAVATTAPADFGGADYDATLSSDERYWRGFSLWFNGSRVVGDPATASEADRTFQLRAVDGDQVGGLVREFTVDTDGTHVIDTASLTGRFVIQYQGEIVYVDGGEGYLDPPSMDEANVTNSDWRVKYQDLSATVADPTPYDGQHTSITLETNRGGDATVAVSGPGLSFNDLQRLFSPTDYASNYADKRHKDVLLLDAGPTHEYELAVAGLAPDTYSLTFSATDTTASVDTSFEVQNGNKFADLERREQAGDVIDASIKCSHCFLMVGSQESGFVDLVELTDENGDGVVDMAINTRYMGLYKGASGVPSEVEAYTSPTDSIDRYQPGDELTSIDQIEANHYLNALRKDLGLNPNGRSAPVGAMSVDLTVAGSDYIMTRKEYGEHRSPLGGDPVAKKERDVKTVVLTDPTLHRLRSYGLSTNFGERENLTGLTAGLTDQGDVAIGDRLVLQVDVSGLEGYLEYAGTEPGIILSNEDEGLDLTLESTDGSDVVRLNEEWTWMAFDDQNDRLYVVIESNHREARRRFTVGKTYRASFSLTGVEGTQSSYDVYSSSVGHAGFPYLDPGGRQRASTTIRFVEPSGTVDTTDGAVRVRNRNPVAISGATTLAPGSIVTVTAVGTGEARWEKSTSVTVGPNRTWTAEFDFSNVKVGEQFSVRVLKDDSSLATADGVVVEETQATSTPEGGSSTAGTSTLDPGRETSATDTPTPTPNEGEGSSGGGPTTSPAADGGSGGMFGMLPSDLPVSVPSLGGLLVPGTAIVGVIALITLIIGRLR